jgi:hypothetical protein
MFPFEVAGPNMLDSARMKLDQFVFYATPSFRAKMNPWCFALEPAAAVRNNVTPSAESPVDTQSLTIERDHRPPGNPSTIKITRSGLGSGAHGLSLSPVAENASA